jgi:hypothetical protein
MAFKPVMPNRKGSSYKKQVVIRLNTSGTHYLYPEIRINYLACEELGATLRDNMPLVLLWDDELHRLGFLRSDDPSYATYRRNPRVTRNGAKISIMNFCRTHSIDPDQICGTYALMYDDVQRIHYIELGKLRRQAAVRSRFTVARNGAA